MARRATLALVRAFVAWEYGRGPAAPYVEAYETWLEARSRGDLLRLPRGGDVLERRLEAIGDERFVASHARHVARARAGRDARLDPDEIARVRASVRRAA